MTGGADKPVGVGPESGSVGRRRHRFGAILAVVALVAMLAVGFVYVGVPGIVRQHRDDHGSRKISVVVAAQEIPRGQRIFPHMVTTSTIRATDLPPHAFRKPSDVWFSRALIPIHKNEKVTNDLLAVPCTDFCPIAQDFVALSLPYDDKGSLNSFAAGDYINVIATVNTAVFSSAHPRLVTRTVFTDVVVLNVGRSPTVRAGPDAAVGPSPVQRIMTIIVSPCDAQYIDWFAVNASLSFGFGPEDYAAGGPPAYSRCEPTAGLIGPAQVDARWKFSSA